MVGVDKAAELAVLIRSGVVLVLERVQQLTPVLFDTTGPLRRGRPELTQVVSMAGMTPEQRLQSAALLEHGLEPPLAAALLEAVVTTGQERLPISALQAQVGDGVHRCMASSRGLASGPWLSRS